EVGFDPAPFDQRVDVRRVGVGADRHRPAHPGRGITVVQHDPSEALVTVSRSRLYRTVPWITTCSGGSAANTTSPWNVAWPADPSSENDIRSMRLPSNRV